MADRGFVSSMKIKVGDLSHPQVIKLLRSHLQSLATLSPPESMHALGIEALKKPDITFWSVWDGDELMGCGALKQLDPQHGELKSMRTAAAYLRKGMASRLLEHMIAEAKRRKYRRLSLETGARSDFKPAHGLYAKFGFQLCGPFGDYVEDPNSVFMTREI